MKLSSRLKSASGLASIGRAFLHSLAGLRVAVIGERAFRQEAVLACLLIPAAIVLPTGLLEKSLLLGSVLLVLVVELLNSAIEATVDRISLEQHELARRAKDYASAAVFLSLVTCAVVWGLVLAASIR